MFKDVGKKIKGVAKGWFIFQCVAAFVGGVVLFDGDEDMVGIMLLIWLLGPLVAWLSSLILYGFGEIVDTAIINRKEQVVPMQKTKPKQPKSVTENKPQKATLVFDEGEANPFAEDAEFVDVCCPRCNEKLSFVVGTREGLCPNCGATFDF